LPATTANSFLKKLRSQIKGARAGFLLGAGSSYLAGAGYPLSGGLWGEIAGRLDPADAQILARIIVGRNCGLEEALDVLDVDPATPFPLRERIAYAIADVFQARNPPLESHRRFVRGLARRSEHRTPILSLNYDPLIEYAAVEECLLFNDGFTGGCRAAFDPASFNYLISTPSIRRGRQTSDRLRGLFNVIKLHGSLGWFQFPDDKIKRIDPDLPVPPGAQRLMIPPQRRKHQDTGIPPYSDLWSEFRGLLNNDGRRLLNRLICVGYGFRDEHVNAIIRAAVGREHFTLVVLARALEDTVYSTWARCGHAIIATETRCCLYGTEVDPLPDVWSFEWLAQEVCTHA
jgi:hypothetical protein